jgi:hypothetical protein
LYLKARAERDMGNDVSITVWEESSEGRSPRVLGVERDSYRDFELTPRRG